MITSFTFKRARSFPAGLFGDELQWEKKKIPYEQMPPPLVRARELRLIELTRAWRK